MNRPTALSCCLALAASALLSCSPPARVAAPPDARRFKASVHGLSGVRFWADTDSEAMARAALAARQRERYHRKIRGLKPLLGPAHYLALSGGGDKGAFAAGLLNGWTEAGGRPQFKLVTGISTGALIAPFAFLGPRYDKVLKEMYTGIKPSQIFKERSLLAAIFDDAMADNKPLLEQIRRRITRQVLEEIAREYERGRLLLVGTVELDLQRPVIWDMGAIAATRNPDARELFCRVMLASAAIPGIFPPTMIDVEVDGQRFQEMHVDGGVVAQVFIYPADGALKRRLEPGSWRPSRTLYVIRNARLDPEWASVERRTMTIASRAIDTLIHNQGLNNLVLIYALARRDEMDYNLAFIGADFNVIHEQDFDLPYMRALYKYGYDKARAGYRWHKKPPGI
jgi:predicted acylesterase/phospholipase RssA